MTDINYNVQQVTSQDPTVKRDIERELNRIGTNFGILNEVLPFNVISVEPLRPELGTMAYADGVNWSPDATGRPAFYIRSLSEWRLVAYDD